MRSSRNEVSAALRYFVVFVIVTAGAGFGYTIGADLDWITTAWLTFATGAAVAAAVSPILGMRDRRMRVATGAPPGTDRRTIIRAVLRGPAPRDPRARDVARVVAQEELGIAMRARAFQFVSSGVLIAAGLLTAVAAGGVAWIAPGVAVAELLVQLLWPRYLRRRVALLSADVPSA